MPKPPDWPGRNLRCNFLYLLQIFNPPPRYYNELWVLHLDELKWSVPALPAGGQAWPSARSGCQVSVNGDTMFVYGGYSKVGQGKERHAGIDGLLSKRKHACLWWKVWEGAHGVMSDEEAYWAARQQKASSAGNP